MADNEPLGHDSPKNSDGSLHIENNNEADDDQGIENSQAIPGRPKDVVVAECQMKITEDHGGSDGADRPVSSRDSGDDEIEGEDEPVGEYPVIRLAFVEGSAEGTTRYTFLIKFLLVPSKADRIAIIWSVFGKPKK